MGIEAAEFSTLVELLRYRAVNQADLTAYSFLVDGEEHEVRITYAELDRSARAIAAALLEVVEPGNRALLLHPPGLDFIAAFFGCQYAGVVAVPTYPPQPGQTLERIRGMVIESGPLVCLTANATQAYFEQRCKEIPEFDGIPWIATDDIDLDFASRWQTPDIGPDSLAFLQFTSGSTGNPKGAMISHGNLLDNQRLIMDGFQLPPDWYGVSWLPLYHDMGLCGQVMIALYTGRPTTFLSPIDFLKHPVRWLQAISRQPGHTMSGSPNFGYELCIRRVTPDQRKGLDLSRWKLAYNGAEVVRADTMDRFYEAYAPYGFRREAFYPTYGMAEATLIISGGDPAAPPLIRTVDGDALKRNSLRPTHRDAQGSQRLVASGRPLMDSQIEIVDPDTHSRRPIGEIGEIWLDNQSVAHGYWQKKRQTTETFQARLADGSGPFLRTGDLGCLYEGQLWVTGRLKEMIIVLGRNHYPEDIEATVQSCHPALRPGCGAAFSVEIGEEGRIVVVQEMDEARLDGVRPATLARAVRREVGKHNQLHLYEVAFIRPRTIPKTSSGKLRRSEASIRYLAEELDLCDGATRKGGEA